MNQVMTQSNVWNSWEMIIWNTLFLQIKGSIPREIHVANVKVWSEEKDANIWVSPPALAGLWQQGYCFWWLISHTSDRSSMILMDLFSCSHDDIRNWRKEKRKI